MAGGCTCSNLDSDGGRVGGTRPTDLELAVVGPLRILSSQGLTETCKSPGSLPSLPPGQGQAQGEGRVGSWGESFEEAQCTQGLVEEETALMTL